MRNDKATTRHAPYIRLKGLLRMKGQTYMDLASYLGISVTTLTYKVNGESDFYLREARMIREYFKDVAGAEDIFFTSDVAETIPTG